MTTLPPGLKPAVLPSPLQNLIVEKLEQSADSVHLSDLHALALQVEHNLRYQHSWTDLHIHTHSPISNQLLPRPLVSGLPPQRLYIHPDEQIELLKNADRKRKASKQAQDTLDVEVAPEPEWVLPTRLNEKWTLRRLSDVFNAISIVPPTADENGTPNPWRTTKRVLLATTDSDSTITYYIVHDGVVKPRQN
ncbi:uncharacterized protein EI97DRAFT_124917 [Westerdykella ornata]|uniref:tRNA-splicing endonuclease subunit Sen15 domain-containing protein n=1 Tax=Westerdykella ornata TaxID=318751 RepID=A0A6A6JWE5_WESOR|nr:uncharacterized protein EI97DRAFT_124917 [Westerdykella ornata]KAF2280524.1 hypothetical protein EI97DRAFT_124917 [Westerdykella ornata]